MERIVLEKDGDSAFYNGYTIERVSEKHYICKDIDGKIKGHATTPYPFEKLIENLDGEK